MLPKTLKIQSTKGDRDVQVIELGQIETPKGSGGAMSSELTYHENEGTFGDHRRTNAAKHLVTWTLPEATRKVRREIEEAVEEGIPNQGRQMLRNQVVGQLENRHVTSIALGQTVERPCQRWSRRKRDTIRVAICLDTTAYWADKPEKIKARMAVASGLASALDSADYDCSVTGASLGLDSDASGHPRTNRAATVVGVVLKEEGQPTLDSGFAHFADTDLRRLVSCWAREANGRVTHLSDREWRQLSNDADLLIYVGPGGSEGQDREGSRARGKTLAIINTQGRPEGMPIGPVGEDALRLEVNEMADIDGAIQGVRDFFNGLED